MAYYSKSSTKVTAKDRKIDKNLEQLLTELFLHDVNFFNFLLLLSLQPSYQNKTVLEVLLANVFKLSTTNKELDQLQTDLAQLDADLYRQAKKYYAEVLNSDHTGKTVAHLDYDLDHDLDDSLDHQLDHSLAETTLDQSTQVTLAHANAQANLVTVDHATVTNAVNSDGNRELTGVDLNDERQDNQGEWIDTLEDFSEDSFDSDDFDDFEEEETEDEFGDFDEFDDAELVQNFVDQEADMDQVASQLSPKSKEPLTPINHSSEQLVQVNKLLHQFSSFEREKLNQFIQEYIDAPLPNPHALGSINSHPALSSLNQGNSAYDLTQVHHYTQELSKLDYNLDYAQNFASKLLTKALTNALVAVNEEAFTCSSFIDQQDQMFEELFTELDHKDLAPEQLTGFEQKFDVIKYLEASRLQYNFSLDVANRPAEDLSSLKQLAQDQLSSSHLDDHTVSNVITETTSSISSNSNSNVNSSFNSIATTSASHLSPTTANLTKFCFMSYDQVDNTPWYKLSDYFLTNGALNKMHCFDISHWGGEDTIGSCVATNIDGVLASEYRYFNITGITPGDDIAAIYQSVDKRYRSISELTDLPLVVMIDGGLNQLNAANKALNPILKSLQARQTYLTILLGGQTLLSTLATKNGLLFAQDSNFLTLVAAEYVYHHYMLSPLPSLVVRDQESGSVESSSIASSSIASSSINARSTLQSTTTVAQGTTLAVGDASALSSDACTTSTQQFNSIDLQLPYRTVSVDTALKVLFSRRSLQAQLTNLIDQEQYHHGAMSSSSISHNSSNSINTNNPTGKLDPLAALSQALGSDSLSQRTKAKETVFLQEQQSDYVLNRLLAFCQSIPTWQQLTFSQQKQVLDYLLVSQASTHLSLTQLEQGVITDLNDISLLNASHPLTQFSLLKRLPYNLTLAEFKKLVFSINCFYVLIHPVKTIGVTKQDHRKLYAEKFLAGDTGDEIEVPMHSNEQYLILKLRDAAHNYANRKRESHYQRTKTYSFEENLKAIPGIGNVTATKLLQHFKTPASLIEFLQTHSNPQAYLVKTVGLSSGVASNLITNAKLLLR